MICAVGETQEGAAAITVAPATAERWPDVLKLVGGHHERGCRGRYWRMSSTHYASSPPGGT